MVRYKDLLADTICAPITAPGFSGVSVVRVSGERALDATAQLTNLKSEELSSHRVYLTVFKDLQNNPIDQILVSYFANDNSFTGDETVEVSCHGNPLIVNQIIDCYLSLGCRIAERGEFSFRSFYNGKMDLIQAESINSLITSKNNQGSQASLDQLYGQFSKKVIEIEKELVLMISHLEASIDFVEEDIVTNSYSFVREKVTQQIATLEQLLKTYDVAKNLQKGYKILLLGPTNVGKSSLFNLIYGENKAIVTDYHGTTRDLVTSQNFLSHHLIELIDSAGIRKTEDPIEQIGIEKSLSQIEDADIVLCVFDNIDQLPSLIESLVLQKTVFVFNKVDLFDDLSLNKGVDEFMSKMQPYGHVSFVQTSTVDRRGIEHLKKEIVQKLEKNNSLDGETAVLQARHFSHLTNISTHLLNCEGLLADDMSPDILSQELVTALSEVHQILGKEYDDEVLDKIFSEFCIGK